MTSAILPRATMRLGVAHQGTIGSVAFSPDGSLVLTGGWDGTAKVWDVGGGDLLRTIDLDCAACDWGDTMNVGFLPDGRCAIGDAWRTERLRILDPRSGRLSAVLPGYDRLLFACGDHRVVVAGYGNLAQVRTTDWRVLWERTLDERIRAAWPRGDGGKVFVAAGERLFALSAGSGEVLASQPIRPEGSSAALCFSPDGRMVAAAGEYDIATRGVIILSRTEGGAELASVRTEGPHPEFPDEVMSLAFSPDSRMLVGGCPTGGGFAWAVPQGRMLYEFQPPQGGWPCRWARHIAFHPDGRTFATVGDDRRIHLRDAATGELRRTLCRVSPAIMQLAVSPDGRLAACGDADGGVRIWDLRTCRVAADLPSHGAAVTGVAFHADGQAITSCSRDGLVRTCRTAEGAELWRRRVEGSLLALAVCPARGLVGVGGGVENHRYPRVLLLDAATGQLRRQVPQRGYDLAFSPDGRVLAMTGCCGAIRLRDLRADRAMRMLRTRDWFDGPVFSPDGRFLTAGGEGCTLTVWDALSFRPVAKWKAQDDGIGPLAFTPNGNRLVVATGYANRFCVWSVRTARRLATLRGHRAPVRSLAISPTGRLLLTGSADGTVGVWDLARYKRLATLHTFPASDGGPAEWVASTPAGEFTCSPGARRSIHWQVGDDLLPAEAFWKELHRPAGLDVVP